MVDRQGDSPRYTIDDGEVTVEEITTGKRVDAPDAAARGMGTIGQAMTATGIALGGNIAYLPPGVPSRVEIAKAEEIEALERAFEASPDHSAPSDEG